MLLPPCIHAPDVVGELCEKLCQLLPSLTNAAVSYCSSSIQEPAPSIVCDDVVAMVNADALELAFFILYIRPIQVVASGKVAVDAAVPVNITVLSVPLILVVVPENAR